MSEKCYDCNGSEGLNYLEYLDRYVCDDCLHHYYTLCDDCGEFETDDERWYVEGRDVYICNSCFENYYFVCDRCGEVFDNDSIYMYDYRLYCSECIDHHRCVLCEETVGNENLNRHNGDLICDDCLNEMDIESIDRSEGFIRNYGYKPTPKFFGTKAPFFGIELELDKGGYNNSRAFKITGGHHDKLYCKYDGSLNDGFEIVTHPLNYTHHRELWRDICKKAINEGYHSHNTSTCGLHVHVHKSYIGRSIQDIDNNINKILFFFENNQGFIVNFCRRSQGGYCDRYYLNNNINLDDQKKDLLKRAKNSHRGRSINLNNLNYSGTLEFRCFKGTLKYNTILATLQFLKILIKTVKKWDLKDIHNLTPEILFNTNNIPRELKRYLRERELNY